MEDGEGDEEASSPRRDKPGVGSRRPREDDSDASSSKRLRSGSDRPLAVAGPLSSPRSGCDSTPSGVEASHTGPVHGPWMPTPRRVESRFGNAAPPSQYAVYSCSGIKDDDITKELDLDPATDQRRDYYIRHFHELQWNRNKKTSRRTLRTSLIAQMSPSAASGRSTQPRAVGDYNSCSSFTPFGGFGGDGLHTPSPFPERHTAVRSAAPTYHGSGDILSNEYENHPEPGSGSDDRQFTGRSSKLTPVCLAVGMEAAVRRDGSDPPDSVDRLETVEHLHTAVFAALRQDLAPLKAQPAQVSQTASNVRVDLGSRLAVLRTRVSARAGVGAESPRIGDSCCHYGFNRPT
ncbi:unnamed protein product [Phytophthora fragariaefolia]|uniref:Unnamed protein product n=1 Tax=Phytophthora fragariaefolia TaxID=1490495 RepID=A0A9W6XSA1_9STRA|nr:unnamed protein product [Phytophthora fragariaefolia]